MKPQQFTLSLSCSCRTRNKRQPSTITPSSTKLNMKPARHKVTHSLPEAGHTKHAEQSSDEPKLAHSKHASAHSDLGTLNSSSAAIPGCSRMQSTLTVSQDREGAEAIEASQRAEAIEARQRAEAIEARRRAEGYMSAGIEEYAPTQHWFRSCASPTISGSSPPNCRWLRERGSAGDRQTEGDI